VFRHFTKKSRATVVQKAFRAYSKATLEFWKVAQQCAVKEGATNRDVPLQKAIRLQFLLIERQAARFTYLFARDTFSGDNPISLDSALERLDRGWGNDEEGQLIEGNSSYRDLAREIEDIKSSWNSNALTEPIQRLETDAKYRNARRVVSERVEQLKEKFVLDR
jgi:hypothetical protein